MSLTDCIVALCWGPGGDDVGYAIYKDASGLSTHEISDVPSEKSLTQSHVFSLGIVRNACRPPFLFLEQFRAAIRPTLYLVPEKTVLPHVLTCSTTSLYRKHESSMDNSHQMHTSRKPSAFFDSTESDEGVLRLLPPKVKYLHTIEFALNTARERLISLRIIKNERGSPTALTFYDGYIVDSDAVDERIFDLIHSHVNVQSPTVLCALSVMISHVRRFKNTTPAGTGFRFNVIPHFMSDHVFVDHECYLELQIFKSDPHPASHQLIGRPKEGLSLFGIMAQTKTRQGSALLRSWFLHLTNDSYVLESRYDAIEFFMGSRKIEVLREALSFINSPNKIAAKIRNCAGTVVDWYKMYKILYNYISLLRFFLEPEKTNECLPVVAGEPFVHLPSLLRQYCQDNFPSNVKEYFTQFQNAACQIVNVLNLEESMKKSEYIIREGCDAELDRLCDVRQRLPQYLTEVARTQLRHVSTELASQLTISVLFFPRYGYLISISLRDLEDSPQTVIHELTQKYDWSHISSTEEHALFKNAATKDLDNSLGDIHGALKNAEVVVLHGLEDSFTKDKAIQQFLSPKTLEVVWILDAILALSLTASQRGWTRPILSKQSILRFQEARHPLLTSTPSHPIIANDLLFGSADNEARRFLFLTGANNSGKSVFLKLIGVLVFMVHIGSFVPAESAHVGPVSAILSCMGSSLHRSFASDLQKVSRMLRFASLCSRDENNEKRLCRVSHDTLYAPPLFLIDEFGRGTLAQDGVALLSAVISHFLKAKQTVHPYFCLSTHYTEALRMCPFLRSEPHSRVVEISTMRVEVSEHLHLQQSPATLCLEKGATSALRYTYRKKQGCVAQDSHALPVAFHCGVPSHIIDCAQKARRCLELGLSLISMFDKRRNSLDPLTRGFTEPFSEARLFRNNTDVSQFLTYFRALDLVSPNPEILVRLRTYVRKFVDNCQ